MLVYKQLGKSCLGNVAEGRMETVIKIAGKPVLIRISPAASRALESAESAILVEMELYFSCLIRKRVLFHHEPRGKDLGVIVSDKLHVCFRPVITRHCGVDYAGDEPPLTDFPIQNASAFVPKWLVLDYHKGVWQGEFGYGSGSSALNLVQGLSPFGIGGFLF